MKLFRQIQQAAFFLAVAMLISTATQAARYRGDKYHGRIESVTDNSVVLLTDGDETVEFRVSDETTITKEAEPSSLDQLGEGDIAFVKARRSNGRLVAVRIAVMTVE